MPDETTERSTYLHLEVAGYDEPFSLAAVAGREAIGQLFDFELTVVVLAPDFAVDELLLKKANLVFVQHGEEVRRIGGIVVEVDDLLDTESRRTTFRVRFAPRAFLWSLRETTEIYLDSSIPDIVTARLRALGFHDDDFEMRLTADYPAREFVVQYKESDLAFVSRLVEHLGISFFFEHRPGSDGLANDVIVFTDSTSGFTDDEAPVGVAFRARGEKSDVFALHASTKVIPNRYVVADYNYRQPGLDLTGETTLKGGADVEVYEYGAHQKTPDEGKKLARIRAEEHLSRRRVYDGTSDLAGIFAARYVVIEGHPRGDVDLLVVEVEHHAAQTVGNESAEGDGYHNDFRAVRRGTPYRPPRTTPKPKVAGVITAQIDAESRGNYAELDDDGRYKVRFMFDQSEAGDGKASRPVRMIQPHSGPGYGMHFPLRPGIEVALVCIDGDPDRPIIAGTVPNPATGSPVTSANNGRNVIKTGGGNEINISDEDNNHRIKMTTPHMNTVFQIGAPNASEAGALLATMGASSTVATGGVAALGGIGTTITAIRDLKSAGDIIAVAQKPGALEKGITLLTIADSITALATAGVDLYVTGRQAKIAKDQDDQNKKDKTLAEKQSAADAHRAAAATAATNFANNPPAQTNKDGSDNTAYAKWQTANQALSDYETALGNLDTDTATAKQAQLDYDDAVRKSSNGDLDGTIALKKQALDAANAKVAADQADVTAKRTAYQTALTAYNADSGKNPTSAAAGNTITTEDTAYVAALPAVATAQADSYNNNKALLDDTYQLQDSDSAKNLSEARTGMELARTGLQLISTLATAYNLLKSWKEKLEVGELWMKTGLALKDAWPRTWTLAESGIAYAPLTYPLGTTHVMGSEETTSLYADKKALVTAPEITVHATDLTPSDPTAVAGGAGRLVLAAVKTWVGGSGGTAELSSKTKTVISSVKDIEILAGDMVHAPPATGTIKLAAEGKITIESPKDDVEITASLLGKKVTVSGEAEVALKTKKANLDTTNEVAIATSLPAGKIGLTAGATGSLVLKLGDFSIELRPAGINIKVTGGPVINVTKQQIAAQLVTGDGIKITPSGVKITGGAGATVLSIDASGVKVGGQLVQLG